MFSRTTVAYLDAEKRMANVTVTGSVTQSKVVQMVQRHCLVWIYLERRTCDYIQL